MAIKSIVDIDVNDAAFKQFNQLWQQYQRQLRATPVSWRNIAVAQAAGVKGFQVLVREQATAIGQQRLLEQANKAALNMLRPQVSIWQAIRRETTGVAVNIRDVTTQLLKWGKVTGVISGLLGAGGLFGVTRMAEGVAGGRRSALGLGTSYGQNKAFNTAFGRLFDPGSVLSGVEGALTNVQNRVSLYNAGLTEKDLGGGSAQVASRLIQSMKRIADHTPDNLLGNVFAARGFGNLGFSEEDFRRIKRTSPEELGQLQRQFGKFSADYAVSGRDQRGYQEFVTALSDAGNQIETVFVKGITPLIPGLTELSKATAEVVKNILGNEGLKQWLDDAGKNLSEFAKYVGKPEFVKALRDFTGDIITIAGWLNKTVSYLGGSSSTTRSTDRSYLGAKPLVNLGPLGTIDPSISKGGFLSHFSAHDIVSGLTGGVTVKAGAGTVTPELMNIARGIQNRFPGFNRITAGEDEFHRGRHSAHNDGRAFDFTISDVSKHAEAAEAARAQLAALGIKGRVIDEYANPSRGATGGHIHVQTEVRVMNAAGSNVIVSAQQVTPNQ